MINRPQTIQIFLSEGTPHGIKEGVITNRLVKTLLFPRKKIKEVAKRKVAMYTGVYFLFGKTDIGVKPVVYIGEGESCLERVLEHNKTKDWWTHGIICATINDQLTKTEAKYLEHFFLQKIRQGGRYHVDNSTGSKKPSIPENREHDILDMIETIGVLIATMGFPVLETEDEKNTSQELIHIKRPDYSASAVYTDEGVIILKGSEARLKVSKSCPNSIIELRKELLNDSVLKTENENYMFLEDYVVGSPSRASDLILGNSSNGWDQWKTSDGTSLNDLYRT